MTERNGPARFRALWAPQYDRRPGDLTLPHGDRDRILDDVPSTSRTGLLDAPRDRLTGVLDPAGRQTS